MTLTSTQYRSMPLRQSNPMSLSPASGRGNVRSGAGMIGRMPWWAWVWPLLAWGVLVATFVGGAGGAVVVAAEAAVLVATVFAAV